MAACGWCGGGKAKRQCPALGRAICSTCCGTRRLVEIACPPGCGWLTAARAHPHAAQQRQDARDSELMTRLVDDLDDRAYAVLSACVAAAWQFRADAVPAPLDEDLEAAAEALAATAATASRGVLYEHQPVSVVAARLSRAMSAPLTEAAAERLPGLDEATTAAMRRLAGTVRLFRGQAPSSPDAFFLFLGRALRPRMADAATGQDLAPEASPPPGEPRIVMP